MADWDADIALDLDRAVDLVRRAFPDLAFAQARSLGEGWDNLAIALDDRWLVRLTRRAWVADGLLREIAWLPRLAPHLPLPIPAPFRACHGLPDHPHPFAVSPLVPGGGLDAHGMLGVEDARRLAAFVAALRAIPAPPEPVDALSDRSDMAYIHGRSLLRLEALREAGGDVPDAVVEALSAGVDAPPSASGPAWCHGDIHPRHVRVDARGRLTGIIDWGDLFFGEPAADTAVAWTCLDAEGRAAFLEALQPCDAELARARQFAAHYTVILQLYGRDIGDQAYVDAAERTAAQLAL